VYKNINPELVWPTNEYNWRRLIVTGNTYLI
jgi:hypothetical protein